MLKVSVIGLSNHAGLHIKLLKDNPFVEICRVYYHKLEYSRPNLNITNNIQDCLESDCIIVSSPTDFHYEHLLALINYKVKMR